MRAGSVDGIVSTSALELGVDIGALDVVVLNGYPGSTGHLAAAQPRRPPQAPGAGRAGGQLSQPLDQYVVRHPDFFTAASPEHARASRPTSR